MDIRSKRIAVLSPVAWRTPPRAYGAWETVASNIAEGLVSRGWKNITLCASGDSVTNASLESCVGTGYEEDPRQVPLVSTMLHVSKVMEQASRFDLIHNNFDYIPLTYSRLVSTPILTTIHGFSEPDILRIYHEHKDTYYVSISDSDRDPGLDYLATVYNGIDLGNLTYTPEPGKSLVFLGRIHADKGAHLAIEVAKRCNIPLVIAGIIQDQAYIDNSINPHIDDKLIRYVGPVNPQQRDEVLGQALALLHLNTIPERFGLVMAEAMGAGVPVIAMDLGSCREVIADGETGFLVQDVSDAVKAVPRIQSIKRSACRRRVENHFTIEHMVAGYESVYEEIFRRESKKQTS
jgi:glycosyltransferase involved in cell wall biosynthesis